MFALISRKQNRLAACLNTSSSSICFTKVAQTGHLEFENTIESIASSNQYHCSLTLAWFKLCHNCLQYPCAHLKIWMKVNATAKDYNVMILLEWWCCTFRWHKNTIVAFHSSRVDSGNEGIRHEWRFPTSGAVQDQRRRGVGPLQHTQPTQW